MNFTEEQVAFRDSIRRMVAEHVAAWPERSTNNG